MLLNLLIKEDNIFDNFIPGELLEGASEEVDFKITKKLKSRELIRATYYLNGADGENVTIEPSLTVTPCIT